uniref:LAGLIDADG endonuclease n=1 Tax=Pyronema omphalodes TaxID=337075 RepID=A0A140IMW0_9PEZI|nr:LAGLIDADG endonuclease [Pyronema omphalodes]AMO66518.1 LAGLIDADG endonuclease [Pyronema omphalodes]
MTRWMVQNIDSVVFIVNMINGKFRTPKINALHRLIDWLNAKGANIPKLPLDTSPLNSNAWFAGFTDADGSFNVKGFSNNPSTHPSIQYYLPQRTYDISGDSLLPIMSKIAEFLSVKLNERTIAEKYTQFIINTSNRTSNKILIDYLTTYHLLSSKHLDFKDWEVANNIYINKLHKDPVQYEKMKSLKENMNNRRTVFSWAHHSSIVYGLV